MQAVAQSEPKDIYTFDDKGEMVVNEKFIDTHVERDDSEVKPYTLIGLTTFEANSKKYELQVLNYKGWENDGATSVLSDSTMKASSCWSSLMRKHG